MLNRFFKRPSGWQAALFAATMMFGGAASHAQEALDVTDPEVVEAFVDGVVVPNMKAYHSPSGVVAVMKGGEVIFKKGYGYIDVEKHIPVDPDTSMFRPGSISKLFTWFSVMQQVEKGKLDLDTDVNQYLKTFQVADTYPGQPVTLRDIMTHTAGFEDGGIGYLIIDDPDRIIPLAESLKTHQPARVNPPGTHTAYSNWGTALAGLIVANVSGVEFNQYVQENIFDVLGMTRSSFVEPLPPELDKNMAKVYKYEAGKYIETNYEIVSNFGPAGAAAVTATDMLLFARAILNGGEYNGKRILKAETLQQMIDEGFAHDPRVRGMGLGFIKRRFGPDGLDNFGHDGGTTKFLSHFGMSKKYDLVVFSSFNGPGNGPVHQAFVKGFYDEFFPQDIPVITPPADFADRAAKYAGTYNSYRGNFTQIEALARGLGGMKVVPMPDNTLLIGETRYVEVEKNLFREVNDYGRVAFQEDENGAITGFVIDGMGVMQLYKAPFYQTTSFISILVGFAVLMFVSVFVRLGYQWSTYRALPKAEKQAFQASVLVASLNILFMVLAGIGVSAGFPALMYELPFIIKFSLVFSSLAALAGLYHLYQAVQVWRAGLYGSVWARVRFSLVTLAAVSMAWFYYYWNLIGFQYFS
ncbi:serine hydrolase domain-containing protein [Kordiimonas pumila]|uniref:Serine hydrolase domain-containing protein n=1 Tax=Kordiimonas pumila TaxID=2161677 RepID=A0ABV7D420_9PROT|nr:serine hydrolase domain-containing protein [Kordiimonas pumila]